MIEPLFTYIESWLAWVVSKVPLSITVLAYSKCNAFLNVPFFIFKYAYATSLFSSSPSTYTSPLNVPFSTLIFAPEIANKDIGLSIVPFPLMVTIPFP